VQEELPKAFREHLDPPQPPLKRGENKLNFLLSPFSRGIEGDLLDAIASILLPDPFHKDPADRILVAIARRYQIPLVTCDVKILNYPHLETIW
jgi:hypothetical protein